MKTRHFARDVARYQRACALSGSALVRRINPISGLTALALLFGSALGLQAQVNCFSVQCAPGKTVNCGETWTFDPPTVVDTCCHNYAVIPLGVVTNGTCAQYLTQYWDVQDGCGHSNVCSQTVTLLHTPVFQGVTNIIVASCSNVVVSYNVTATEPCCGALNVVCTPPSGSSFAPGTSPVVCTATDCCGNAFSNQFFVNVIHTTNQPVFQGVSNITLTACGPTQVSYHPTATEACCGSLSVACSPPSGSLFQLGATSVSCTVTDCFNQSVTNTFTVSVVAPPPPQIQGANNLVFNSCTNTPVFYNPVGVSTCCSNVTVICTPPSGTIMAPGSEMSVTCVATDCLNQSVTNTFTVSVVAPTLQLTCNPDKTVPCGTNWSFDSPGVQQGCCPGFQLITLPPVTNSLCPLNITETWVATNSCGGNQQCSQTVTVQSLPVFVSCNNVTVLSSNPLPPAPVATSLCCSNVTVVLANSVIVTNGLVEQDIYQTWVATDCCGNSNFCSRTVGIVSLQTNDIVAGSFAVNGSFELPVLPANSYKYSSDADFTLPGWTYPTDPGVFFLENGSPSGSPRYLDGSQAVCLNGQGTPVTISQTIATVPGQNYVLTFGQSDTNNAGPSCSQLTVDVAGMTRIFSRSNDTGYVVKRWQFTAISNFTTVSFTDTTPGGCGPSPFLDSVCINLGGSPIAGTGTPLPGSVGPLIGLPASPIVKGNNALFLGLGGAGQMGIYGELGINPGPNPGPLARLLDLNDTAPSGKTFANFNPGTAVSLNPQPLPPGSSPLHFVFGGIDASGLDGIYSRPIGPSNTNPGPVVTIVDRNTAVPGGTGNFGSFTPKNPGGPVSLNPQPLPPGVSGDNIAFWASGSGGQQGIYAELAIHSPDPSPIIKVADTQTPVPGGNGAFKTFNPGDDVSLNPQPLPPGIWEQNVVFWAEDSQGNQGVYGAFGVHPGPGPAPVTMIADTHTVMPGFNTTFQKFDPGAAVALNPQPLPPGISGGGVVFWGEDGSGHQGIYARVGPGNPGGPVSELIPIADTSTPIPGGQGNFTSFTSLLIGPPPVPGGYAGPITFIGAGANGQQGVFATRFPNPTPGPGPVELIKIVDLNDTLDGKIITNLNVNPGGLDGFQLAYTAWFSDGSQGAYIIPAVADVVITGIQGQSGAANLKFSSPAGHSYTVLSSPDLLLGSWTDPGTLLPGNGSFFQTALANLQPKANFMRILQKAVPQSFNNANPPQAPTVGDTSQATSIGNTSATLSCTVNPNGLDTSAYFIYYSNTPPYRGGISSAVDVGSGNTPISFSVPVSGLIPQMSYGIVAFAGNSVGTVSNGYGQFTTGPFAPAVGDTSQATSIGNTSATLSCTVNPNGLDTSAYFLYWPTTGGPSSTSSYVDVGAGTTPIAFSIPVSGLSPQTSYHVVTFAGNSVGTVSNGYGQFSTGLYLPLVTAAAAVGVTANSAIVAGVVNPNGADTIAYFEYGLDTSYGSTAPLTPVDMGSGTGPQALVAPISGLVASSTYHYRIVAYSPAGAAFTSDATFSTGP